jgi:predicted phosphodiesterase
MVMKIAIFGDVHGNIEALKVAYDAAVAGNVDKTYHLGDLGGYAPFVMAAHRNTVYCSNHSRGVNNVLSS